MIMASEILLPSNPASTKHRSFSYSKSRFPAICIVVCLRKSGLGFFHVTRPSFINNFKRMKWSITSSADGSELNSFPTNNSGNGTRLIRAIQAIQTRLCTRFKDLRRNLPIKLFFFLVGFYCATAFATVIGQTGDWDILSAALAVAVVEGIGALMYGTCIPLLDKARNLITILNYWKAGLSLGLFLDSFKY